MDKGFHGTHLTLFGRDYLYDLVQDPLWYEKFGRLMKARIIGSAAAGSFLGMHGIQDAAKQSRERLYSMFAELLDRGEVALGQPDEGLYEWDKERLDVDTIVIHHSTRARGIDLSLLNAMELLRLYVPAYRTPAEDDSAKISGKPIYSGHFRNGRQTFYPYHWIIRQDGTSERLLEDHEWGWHAGNLDVNRRSVSLCFDDDLSHKTPNAAMITEARRIIHDEYAWLYPNGENVVGHKSVSKIPTECPGDMFVTDSGWKFQLL